MADQDSRTPDHGPVPDPHGEKPMPRRDSHTRPEPGADTPRPDQYEDAGPLPELLGVAGLEAASRVSDDPVLREEAIRRGAEVEGLETAQIFGLLVATVAVLIVLVVAVAVMMTRVGVAEEERRLAELRYPELAEIRAAADERLTTYGRVDDRYHIPLERAQALMAEEARAARQAGIEADRELPVTRRAFNLDIPRTGLPGLIPVPAPVETEPRPGEVEGEDTEPMPAEADIQPDDAPEGEAPTAPVN